MLEEEIIELKEKNKEIEEKYNNLNEKMLDAENRLKTLEKLTSRHSWSIKKKDLKK